MLRSFCPYCYVIFIIPLNVLFPLPDTHNVTWLPGGDNGVHSGHWGQILEHISTLGYSKLTAWGVLTLTLQPHQTYCCQCV